MDRSVVIQRPPLVRQLLSLRQICRCDGGGRPVNVIFFACNCCVFCPCDKSLSGPMHRLNRSGRQQLPTLERFGCGKIQTTASAMIPSGGQQATHTCELTEEHGGRHPETMTELPRQCSRTTSSSLTHPGVNSTRALPERDTDGHSQFPVTVMATLHFARPVAEWQHYGRSVVPIR